MKISKPSRFLLVWLSKQPTGGCSSITPVNGAAYDEQPGMVHMRGLIKRGWAVEARQGNKPWGQPLGIFYITEAGRVAVKQLLGVKG